jgi:RNA polymerase sigma-70 factor (ECF subfamily)
MDFRRDILPLKNVLFRTALRITQNREEAEDAVQDTLLRLWERRDELLSIRNIEAFAITAMRNLLLDRMALAHNRDVSLDEELHDRQDTNQPTAHDILVHDESIGYIQRIIDQLPEKQRTALQLRDIEGMSYREIAEIMATTESDVKISIYRGRTYLKQHCRHL